MNITLPRKPWSEFANLTSATPTRGPEARRVRPEELVDMTQFHNAYCETFAAYAQNNHVFDQNGRPYLIAPAEYGAAPRLHKVNKFGQAYKDNAKIWLHKDMAGVVLKAAEFMHREYGWTTLLYDGLRTVDGAYNLYLGATQSDLDSKILAPPGLSAHNKGMAVDLVMFYANGKFADMGGNFDHLDMKTNHRNYKALPPEMLENRRKREIAFQHAALSEGKLFAPLRAEFWDERFPENEADHWRVLESLCRCLGKTLLSEEDERNLTSPRSSAEREAFRQKWEVMSYEQFRQKWHELFADHKELRQALKLPTAVALPPARETVIYHGDFHPLYDRDLPLDMQLTVNE